MTPSDSDATLVGVMESGEQAARPYHHLLKASGAYQRAILLAEGGQVAPVPASGKPLPPQPEPAPATAKPRRRRRQP